MILHFKDQVEIFITINRKVFSLYSFENKSVAEEDAAGCQEAGAAVVPLRHINERLALLASVKVVIISGDQVRIDTLFAERKVVIQFHECS